MKCVRQNIMRNLKRR